jgi:hypothetical protein
MRRLTAAILLGLISISPASALSGATADSADRFPFVVKCSSLGQCGDAGIRRYLPISIKESADCFNDSRGHPRYPPLPPELTAVLPLAVWCMESNVMPGDSGGALLVEGTEGQLYYLGVISAQQGLFPEIGAGASERRSLATALYPSLGFIADRARKLGYEP